jgi:hypothetical protein
MSASDEMAVTIDHVSSCPFCGGIVQLDLEQCAVLHEAPGCATYLAAEDSMDFLTKMGTEADRLRKVSPWRTKQRSRSIRKH